jgi:hypothetical protein
VGNCGLDDEPSVNCSGFGKIRNETDYQIPREYFLTVGLQEEIDVRLIQVPILALDRQHRPVTDLSPDEIVVKDRGREVEVAFFEPFFSDLDEAPVPDVRLRVDLPGTEKPVASGGAEPRYVVLFVDVENDQPLGKMQAAQDLIDYMIEDLDPSYRAAVLSFDGEIRLHQSFTSDRMAVTRAIREAFDPPRRPQVDLRARVRQLIDRVEDCLDDDVAGALVRDGGETCLRTVALEHADEERPRSRSRPAAIGWWPASAMPGPATAGGCPGTCRWRRAARIGPLLVRGDDRRAAVLGAPS